MNFASVSWGRDNGLVAQSQSSFSRKNTLATGDRRNGVRDKQYSVAESKVCLFLPAYQCSFILCMKPKIHVGSILQCPGKQYRFDINKWF